MEIKNTSSIETEILVINMFEGEKTSQELANTYALEKDNFEGKFGQTYLLHTLGNAPANKILIIGCGKRENFDSNKMREIVSKSIKWSSILLILASTSVYGLCLKVINSSLSLNAW